MIDGLIWFFTNVAMAFANTAYALANPASWLDWSNPEALMRFVYYGASVELFFAILVALTILTGVGLWRPAVMWGTVRGLEGFANAVGRFVAWAGLLMVLQQIVIVFSQRIFAASELGIGLGSVATFDLSWWAEQLKLYNAAVVCLCFAWTFVQGGHVRVDLLYAPASFRAKKVIDMLGAVFFMMPFAVLVWLYGWFFQWRSLITPPVSASDTLDRMLLKARAVRWNVETVGFSPNGFNAYFLFKTLLLAFAAMVFLQAIAVLYRSWLELRQGAAAADRYLDRDDPGPSTMGPGTA